MPHDFHCLFAVRRADFEDAVKPTGAAQGIRQLADIVCRSDDEHVRPFYLVDARLYRDEFFGIARIAVGGEFIDVVQKNDRRRMRLCLCKHAADGIDKRIVRLILAACIAYPAHLFDERGRHQRFTHARHAVQQDTARQLYPQRRIFFGILRHVAQLVQFFFFFFIADYFVECTHNKPLFC